MTTVTRPTHADVQAMAYSLNSHRSSKHVRELAAKYGVTETYVEALAHQVVNGTFEFESEALIYESAPTPKGPTMGNRTVQSLSTAEAGQIARVLRTNGTAPTVRANLRKQYQISEAAVDAFARVITESRATPSTVLTESAPALRHERILYEAAQELLDGANRAEVDLTNASISDLEKYATLGIARQAFGR